MLSYQHVYHAGNHADILKHYVLCCVIEHLNKKEKPYALYDTHAGSGLYDLEDNRSIKTSEAERGILYLKNFLDQNQEKGAALPQGLKNYLELIQSFLKKNLYPGSPLIEQSLMRPSDQLILSELHPAEIENLRTNINAQTTETNLHKNVSIHNRSGWEMVKALTPPAQKRGAVLIDPSYEETKDYTDAAETICQVHKKWTNGIIMLWYPLLTHREAEINRMVEQITSFVKKTNENTTVDNYTLCAKEKEASRMYGSGMLVINTPWNLSQEAGEALEFLSSVFCS